MNTRWTIWGCIFGVMLICSSCSQNPRWEQSSSTGGELHFLVREPYLSESADFELVPIRVITGEEFPFEPGIWEISDLDSDSQGVIYLADSGHGHITKFTAEAEYIGTIGNRGPGPFEFQRSFSPSAIAWIAESDEVVALEQYRTVVFNSDGSPTGKDMIGLSIPSLTSSTSSYIACIPADEPLIEYDSEFEEIRRFGRPLQPDDTPWPEQKESLGEGDTTYKYEQVGPPPQRLISTFEAIGDTFLVHALETRNSYRCWNRLTGQFEWQLDLEVRGYEPPTIWAYESTVQTAEFSWKEGEAHFNLRTRPIDMSWQDGLLFVSVEIQSKGRRKKPDRMLVESPATVGEELDQGWNTRLELIVLSMKPDLIAQIPLDISSYAYIEVLPNHTLIVGYNEPTPVIQVYDISYLWN